MPLRQTANVPNYSLGAPATLTEVARWSVLRGGRLQPKLTASSGVSITYSIQVSVDGITWVATSAANNATVFTSVVANAWTDSDAGDLLLRQGTDNYVRLLASGSGAFEFQVRGEENVLQPITQGLSMTSSTTITTV